MVSEGIYVILPLQKIFLVQTPSYRIILDPDPHVHNTGAVSCWSAPSQLLINYARDPQRPQDHDKDSIKTTVFDVAHQQENLSLHC